MYEYYVANWKSVQYELTMTFSHKTENILFHTRKFLSDKHALNIQCRSDNCLTPSRTSFVRDCKRILTQTVFKKHFLYSVCKAKFIPQNDDIHTEHLILRNKNGMKYGVSYTRL